MRPAARGPDGGDQRLASGREKHTQKITVYLSAEELLDLERARLALLRYGASADRGRIVREAIAVLLADLDARGQESLLARRIAAANSLAAASSLPDQNGTSDQNGTDDQNAGSEKNDATDQPAARQANSGESIVNGTDESVR